MTIADLRARLSRLERDRWEAELQDDFAFTNGTIRSIDKAIAEVRQLIAALEEEEPNVAA